MAYQAALSEWLSHSSNAHMHASTHALGHGLTRSAKVQYLLEKRKSGGDIFFCRSKIIDLLEEGFGPIALVDSYLRGAYKREILSMDGIV